MILRHVGFLKQKKEFKFEKIISHSKIIHPSSDSSSKTSNSAIFVVELRNRVKGCDIQRHNLSVIEFGFIMILSLSGRYKCVEVK